MPAGVRAGAFRFPVCDKVLETQVGPSLHTPFPPILLLGSSCVLGTKRLLGASGVLCISSFWCREPESYPSGTSPKARKPLAASGGTLPRYCHSSLCHFLDEGGKGSCVWACVCVFLSQMMPAVQVTLCYPDLRLLGRLL